MVNSRAKGNKFELVIARAISVWWTGSSSFLACRADQLPFRRTPGSGGWDKRRGGESDLFIMDDSVSNFPYGVECKNQQAWTWDQVHKGNAKCPILSYWDQCVKACNQAGDRTPLLIFTRNQHPNYVCLEVDEANRIGMPWDFHWRRMGLVFSLLDDLFRVNPSACVTKAEAVLEETALEGDRVTASFRPAPLPLPLTDFNDSLQDSSLLPVVR